MIYLLATLAFIYAEIMAVYNSNPMSKHIMFLLFIAWNVTAIWSMRNRVPLGKYMLKYSAYFQLFSVVIGYLVLLTGNTYSIQTHGKDYTHIVSFIIVVWAVMKLFAVKLGYKNT